MAKIVFLRSFRFRRRRKLFALTSILSGAITAAGSAAVSFSGNTVVPGALSAAGSASVSDSGGSIAAASQSAAGSASASFVGNAISSPATLSSAGSSAFLADAKQYSATTWSIAGASTASFSYPHEQITSTLIMQKPVDYALAGDQEGLRQPAGIRGRLAKMIFRE